MSEIKYILIMFTHDIDLEKLTTKIKFVAEENSLCYTTTNIHEAKLFNSRYEAEEFAYEKSLSDDVVSYGISLDKLAEL